MAPDPKPVLERFFNVSEAAVRLGLRSPNEPGSKGERWLRDGVNRKRFPHHRTNRHLMFSDSDLAEIAAMHRNAPTRAGRPSARRRAT